MKKLLVVCFFLCVIGTAQAKKPVFFTWGGETIEKVEDFPNTYDFKSSDGYFVDAGFRYKQVTIFFIPVWNYDIEWCGYISDAYYVDLDRAKLEELSKSAGVNLPDDFPLSFWNKFGGKLVFVAVFGLLLLFKSNSSNSDDGLVEDNTAG
ncbi:MAG: hypothetical protein ACKO5C_06650 [Ferruginibacter sp.]